MFKEKKEAPASENLENPELVTEQPQSPETVRRSIKERLAHFFGQDREIEDLATRTDLQNPTKLAEIKEEIQLEPSLAQINAEARDLEAETLESLSGKGRENKSEEENFYEQELLPLLKVLAPDDLDFAQYEDSILSELRQVAETLQDRDGRATASSEQENLQEMKSILLARCRQTIFEQEKLLNSSARKEKNFDLDPLKRARVALLAGGDFSDINKGQMKWNQYSAESLPSYFHLFNYLQVKNSTRYSASELSAPEISALMKAGMTPQFLKMDFSEQKKYFKVFTDEFLRLLNEKEKGDSQKVQYVLEYQADPQGYSRETFQHLLASDNAYALNKFLKSFEKDITPDDVKDLILRYNPGYPYCARDLIGNINSLSWSEEEKGGLVDFIILHNYVDVISLSDRNNFLESLTAEQLAKYQPICEDIANLITIPGRWDRFKPENLPEEKMAQLRQHVENGRLSFLRLEGYLEYFLNTDYDWVLTQALRFNQEELLLSVPEKFHQDDQRRLAEKFLAEGKADILNKVLSDRSACFSSDTLSLDVYKQLMAQGYCPPFRAFAQIDEEVVANVLKKEPNLLKGEHWYSNVHKASLNSEELVEQKQYQEIAAFIHEYFPEASENLLYQELRLNADFLKGSDPEAFKVKIKANTEVFRQHYLQNLKEDEVLSDKDLFWAINSFCKHAGYDLYLQDSESLAVFLENSRFVPITLAGNRAWFRASTEALSTLPKDRRQEESKNFKNIFNKDAGNNKTIEGEVGYFDNFKLLNLRHSFKNETNDFFRSFFKKVGTNRSLLIKNASLWTGEVLGSPADKEHWAEKFLAYVSANENQISFSEADKKGLDDLFSGPYRDQCLQAFQDEWALFLNSKEESLPFPLKIVTETVEKAGGAGNLKHFEALSGLVGRVGEACDNKKTAARTKKEIKDILSRQETRFEKDKWSQSDRSNFYNLADDLIAAAPSIFSSFAPIFENLSGKEIKAFSKELLPLYQAQLIVLQDTDQNGEAVYKSRDLVPFRNKLEFLAASMKLYPEDKGQTLAEEKERLINDVSSGFKNRFGLAQFPRELKKEDLRTLQNCVRYIGNISHRDSKKESILSLFLSLELKKEWADFRAGKKIDFKKHLTPDKLKLISSTLEDKAKNTLSPEILGIKETDLPAFQEILQKETKNSMLGSLETIDVKVGKIKNGLKDLADPDAYNDPIDKSLLALQSSAGRQVGATLAKTYNELEGRPVTFSEAERAIQKELAQVFQISAWDQATVKKIQDRAQPFNLLSNLLKKTEEDKVDDNIKELRRRLLPSAAVTAIFNRLDEAFKPDSGAHASFKDLEYLESQVIKEESQLKPEEKKLIQDYLQGIKEKMFDLEKIASTMEEYFDKIKNNFDNLERLEPARRLSPLANRLQELEKIVHSTGEGMIVSRVTNDLNFIIENMRQCLGCLRKEANNDTNLSFGDFNKFFMMSEQEKRSGSVADEIVFFVPLETAPGEKEMSFVMDRVYGTKSADILLAHTLAVHKKYRALKDKFPEAKLSLAVTDSALSSAGIDANLLTKKMQEKLGDNTTFKVFANIKVDIPASSLSDNYIEFADRDARRSGERSFAGLLIR